MCLEEAEVAIDVCRVYIDKNKLTVKVK